MSSLASQTMVPTWTMLGRLTPTCCCGVSAKEAVATGAIMAPRGSRALGGGSARQPVEEPVPRPLRQPTAARRRPVRRPVRRPPPGRPRPRAGVPPGTIADVRGPLTGPGTAAPDAHRTAHRTTRTGPRGDDPWPARPPRRGTTPPATSVRSPCCSTATTPTSVPRCGWPSGAARRRPPRWRGPRSPPRPPRVAAVDAGGLDVLVLDGEAVPGRRDGAVQAAEGRDLPLPAGARAHRPPGGRLARDLVAGRPRRAAPARPGRPSRRPWPSWRGAGCGRGAVTTAPAGPVAGAPATSWPHLHRHAARRQDLGRDETAWAMEQVMTGSATRRAARRLPRRAACQGRDGRGARRPRRRRCCATPCPSTSRARRSTSSAPAATGGTPSTSRRWRRSWSRAPARRVVKHGNRAASSACGAADVLEALGVRLDLPPARVAGSPREVGHHLLLRPAVPPRVPARGACPARARACRRPSTSSGPLTNPAQPLATAVGVADARMAPIVAGVLAERGATALVFRGDDGLDELTTADTVDGVGGGRRRGRRGGRSTPSRSGCPG